MATGIVAASIANVALTIAYTIELNKPGAYLDVAFKAPSSLLLASWWLPACSDVLVFVGMCIGLRKAHAGTPFKKTRLVLQRLVVLAMETSSSNGMQRIALTDANTLSDLVTAAICIMISIFFWTRNAGLAGFWVRFKLCGNSKLRC